MNNPEEEATNLLESYRTDKHPEGTEHQRARRHVEVILEIAKNQTGYEEQVTYWEVVLESLEK